MRCLRGVYQDVDGYCAAPATLEGDGAGWLVILPSVAGCHSDERSIAEAHRTIREALAVCVDVFADAPALARECCPRRQHPDVGARQGCINDTQRARDSDRVVARLR